jgi:hypothetical protein
MTVEARFRFISEIDNRAAAGKTNSFRVCLHRAFNGKFESDTHLEEKAAAEDRVDVDSRLSIPRTSGQCGSRIEDGWEELHGRHESSKHECAGSSGADSHGQAHQSGT